MFFKKKNQEMDERLDRAGSELVRAAGLSEFESDAAAAAPFLYARVRARIEGERQRSEKDIPAAALLSISNIQPIFDSSVEPGGMMGTLIARGLASGLNTVGATVLLIAIAATGLLLATNFSFIGLYEKLVSLIVERFASVSTIPARFKSWREAREERARVRKEQRELLKAQQLAAREAAKASLDLDPEQRIAQFMKEGSATAISSEAISRAETAGAQQVATIQGSTAPARAAAAGAGVPGTAVVNGSGRRSRVQR